MRWASPKLPVSTVPELVAYMKTSPGTARCGGAGIGGPIYMGIVLLGTTIVVNGLHVPYKGIGSAFSDMLVGDAEVRQGMPRNRTASKSWRPIQVLVLIPLHVPNCEVGTEP